MRYVDEWIMATDSGVGSFGPQQSTTHYMFYSGIAAWRTDQFSTYIFLNGTNTSQGSHFSSISDIFQVSKTQIIHVSMLQMRLSYQAKTYDILNGLK